MMSTVTIGAETTSTRELDEEEMRAWRTVMSTLTNLADILDTELENKHSLGLADYEVFLELSRTNDSSQRMTELARAVRLSPSGLTRRLDGLVRHGYIERKPCPSDGRGLLAVLTSAGHDKLMEMSPTHASGVRRHFTSCISRGQLQEIQSIFTTISDRSGSAEEQDIIDTEQLAGSRNASSSNPVGSEYAQAF